MAPNGRRPVAHRIACAQPNRRTARAGKTHHPWPGRPSVQTRNRLTDPGRELAAAGEVTLRHLTHAHEPVEGSARRVVHRPTRTPRSTTAQSPGPAQKCVSLTWPAKAAA